MEIWRLKVGHWRTDARTDARTHARTLRWFYTLSNAMHCIGQTIIEVLTAANLGSPLWREGRKCRRPTVYDWDKNGQWERAKLAWYQNSHIPMPVVDRHRKPLESHCLWVQHDRLFQVCRWNFIPVWPSLRVIFVLSALLPFPFVNRCCNRATVFRLAQSSSSIFLFSEVLALFVI